ncbi:hypothetical protein ACFJIW_12020 [Tahibacter sp. UC22_41]|uniref:hypothetical protein n=1 Tax=Tahibacter sp. UC22_41 TaxID=3350178 RepID=UPI0036DF8641
MHRSSSRPDTSQLAAACLVRRVNGNSILIHPGKGFLLAHDDQVVDHRENQQLSRILNFA